MKPFGRVLALILIAFCLAPAYFGAPTSFSVGPNFPTSGVDDASVGNRIWNNPGYILVANDGHSATASAFSVVHSHYLKGTGFGFNIP